MSQVNDHEVAERVATEVGDLLVKLRAENADLEPSQLKDLGDQRAHDRIMEMLGELRPDDAILSEEGSDNLDRLNSERVWIVDPLDGTREFSEIPRTDWAVHIALTEQGQPKVGAVALPAQSLTLSTNQSLSLKDPVEKTRVIVSRTRRPAPAIALAEKLNAEYIEMGSAGAKAMAVVTGEADIYAHAGGQYEWDSCAPVAVCLAAGLHCSRIDGSPMVYNNENPYLPDLLICRPELAERSLEILSELPEE